MEGFTAILVTDPKRIEELIGPLEKGLIISPATPGLSKKMRARPKPSDQDEQKPAPEREGGPDQGGRDRS